LSKPTVIAVCNQKGGCAKTTTVFETSACLAKEGARVLAMDLDHQCDLTEALGHTDEETPGTYELITGKKNLNEVVLESNIKNLYFVPASIDLSAAETELMGMVGREHQLLAALADAEFDYIILDNPPNLGVVVMNSMAAADFVVVPVQVYKFARKGLYRISSFYEVIKQRVNPGLKGWKVLPTLLDFRRGKDVEKLAILRQVYGDKVFSSQIHVNSMILESQEVSKPAVVIDKHGAGAKQYRNFALELREWLTGVGASH
jgi:chromosome partitioning protein